MNSTSEWEGELTYAHIAKVEVGNQFPTVALFTFPDNILTRRKTMDQKTRVMVVSTIVVVSVLLGLAIPTFIPAVRAVNSKSVEIGQVVGYATLHIKVASGSGTSVYYVYYECTLPLVSGGAASSTNTVLLPDSSHAIIIDPTNSTLCHQVNG